MPADRAPHESGTANARVAADRPTLTGPRDRRVHAIAVTAVGTAIGAVMSVQNLLTGPGGTALRALSYLVIVGGAFAWAERAARTVPRHAKLATRLGIGGSLLVGLTLVLPWLNLAAQDRPNTLAMVLIGGAAIALPSWLAAAYIARVGR